MRFTYLLASVNLLVLLSVLNAQKPSNLCKNLLKSPNFDLNLVVGKPWRIYFTWGIDYEERCVEITLKKLNRTSGIIHRFASDMGKYMINDVAWEDATLLLSKYPVVNREGEVTKEMLLFPKYQDGYFDGIHDFADLYSDYLPRRSVPLNQVVLKVLRKGKYLLMVDCRKGITFLMARPNETVYRWQVLELASEIRDDFGYTTCSSHKTNKESDGVLIDDNKII